jgi:outer membrane lipoprotein
MATRIHLFGSLILFGLISGCAVISPELRAKVDSSLTFEKVFQNPCAYKGKIVLWGGEIIQTLPQKEGATMIEVLKWPLNWREEPRRTVSFHGKFLVLVKDHLDLSLYERGKDITVAGEIEGEIQGKEDQRLSDDTYRYPLILSKELHLWKYYFYPYSSVPAEPGRGEYPHYERFMWY